MKWTKAYRRSHGKELLFDKSLEFEKKREEPVRYNRDLYVKTVQAMKRVDAIRTRREKAFINNRIKQAKKNNKDLVERELMKHIDLVANKDLKARLRQKKDQLFEAKMAKETQQTKLQKELQRNKVVKAGKMEQEELGSARSDGDSDDESGDNRMSEEEIN